MNKKGRNLQDVKAENRTLVLKLICTGQCTSRMDISHKTGLSKMTITNIIQELIKEKLICEGEMLATNTVGRKPMLLYPDETSKRSIGVYISRDGIVISLLSLSARIIREINFDISKSDNSVKLLEKILAGIHTIMKSESKKRILGIGVACIGPLDAASGKILSPTDFYGIENVEIKKFLEDKTGWKVIVNNDMNAAALAEQLYGYGVGNDNFIYMGLTHGVGAGIIVNGKLYTGENGFGGELGHMCIKFDGPLCTCGNHGCLEVYASMTNFISKIRNDAIFEKHESITSITNLTFANIVEIAKAGDAFALKRVVDLIHNVAVALINTLHLLNSSKIFIGHESAQGGEWFAKQIQDYINRRLLFRDSPEVRVMISKFKELSPVAGSGVLVFDQVFQGKLNF